MDKDPKHNSESTVDQLLRLQPKVPHQRRTLVTEGYPRNPPCQVETLLLKTQQYSLNLTGVCGSSSEEQQEPDRTEAFTEEEWKKMSQK